MHGNARRYIELLRQFARGHADDPSTLQTLLATADRQAGRLLAHTLVGAAATLGASRIADAARRLEEGFRGDPEKPLDSAAMNAQASEIQAAFDALAACLSAIPPEPDGRAGNPVDPVASRKLMARLDVLLADSDTETIDLIRERADVVRDVLGNDYDLFVQKVHRFDFLGARDTLRQRYPSQANA
jgi:HPt (histidine-containing phosphotransfer) domain-containing protein